ncbi:MAG: hypothetical protein FWC27_02980, partial [Firmicutes bacterium]|nr:hypothetical protein [Bacillota bacterium]
VVLLVLLMGLCAHGVVTPEWETTPHPTRTTEPTTESTVTITADKDDPLSYVVEEYLEMYNEILNDNNQYMLPHYYFLYDVDDNGTKELLIGMEWWDQISLYVVYTIQNGEAVLQKGFRPDPMSGGPAMLFKNGTIRSVDEWGYIIAYHRFEDGELRWQTTLIDNYDPQFDIGQYYCVDVPDDPQKTITKAEFDRVRNEFEGDGQVVELDWKPLAEYGRQIDCSAQPTSEYHSLRA